MSSIPHSSTPHPFPSPNPNLIHTIDCQFVDNTGRTVLLRGVNLSGGSKSPLGQLSWKKEGFWEGVEESLKIDEEEGGKDKSKGSEKEKLSFIGRPFNLDDGSADVHLARLKGWGFNILRFPFCWEALEHEGPGIYDYEYIDYTIRVLVKCSDYGFKIMMDPHQDTWSRFSGGDGAPYWTLPACGINPRNFTATQAAILHCEYPTPESPNPVTLPAMLWSTNYGRLLSQTLFTLFFAGRTYAPKCIIDNLNIQDWLQSHYIKACGVLADKIANFENGRLLDNFIIGWDSFNEPSEGFCGWDDLNCNPAAQGSTLKKGTYPTPAQSLRLGMGAEQTVDNWSFGKLGPVRDGQVTIDPKGLKIWAEPLQPNEVGVRHGELPDGRHTKWGWKRDVDNWPLGKCIWALHGVWDIETGYVLRPDYFKFKYNYSPSSPDTVIGSKPTEFLVDYWKPHFIDYATRIRQSHPLAILFVQPPVFAPPPPLPESILQGRCAYAPHFYDGLTLVSRHWNWFNADALGLIRGKYGHGVGSTLRAVKIGESAIRKSLQEQMRYFLDDVGLISACADHDGEEDEDEETGDDDESEISKTTTTPPHPPILKPRYPTILGEIGTPFDMDSRKSYGYTDNGKYMYDYTSQTKSLDASMNGLDGKNAMSWTIWQYVPDDHTWEFGDGWDMEDLSVWSWDDWREEKVKETVATVQLAESTPMVVTSSPKVVAASSSLSLSSSLSVSGGTPRLRLTSSGSTPSIPSPSSPLSSSQSSLSQPLNLKGYSQNPYDFLTNGARAVGAFVRPCPLKVVGKPVDIMFDIGKGLFKLEVEVRKGDRALLGAGKNEKKDADADVKVVSVDNLSNKGVGSGECQEEEEEEGEEGLATEIYIPLVHYAHSKVLESSWLAGGKSKKWSDEDVQLMARRVESNATLYSAVSSLSTSTITSPLLDPSSNSTKPKKSKSDQHSKITSQSMESTPDLVDIQVKVSDGHWSVCGQTLKWWYDVPSSTSPGSSSSGLGGSTGLEEEDSSSEKDGDGVVKKYTIEIQRREGPLRIANNKGGVGRECCEGICEEGRCLIM